MTIEIILEWAFKIIQEADSSFTTESLVDQLSQQFQTSKENLEVLLSLDVRFIRDQYGQWKINPSNIGEVHITGLVKDAIILREEAINSLLNDKKIITEKIYTKRVELSKVINRLEKLGVSSTTESKIIKIDRGDHRLSGLRITDKRYKSFWPLPGGRDKYIHSLTMILLEIADKHPSMDYLTEWSKEEFNIGNWAHHMILACVVYPGFASREGDGLRLTATGDRFLHSKDLTIVTESIIKNIWGINEMLSWLEQSPMTLDGLLRKFNDIGAGWKRKDQVKYRVNWLVVLGEIREDNSHSTITYQISKR